MTVPLKIDLNTAHELFREADDFVQGNGYITYNSRIRELAEITFGSVSSRFLDLVCTEIFRVIAADCYAQGGRHG